LANNSVAIPATAVRPVGTNPWPWCSVIAACTSHTYPARGVLLQRRQDRPAKPSALHVGMRTHPLHFANLADRRLSSPMATVWPWTVPTRDSLLRYLTRIRRSA
jgi:hypothetical protein